MSINPLRGWDGLHPLSKALYQETYFKPKETYDSWLENRVKQDSNDEAHFERLKTYIKNYWFHPSTPPSSGRGLPISCYVSHIEDTRKGIFDGYLEGMWLGAEGGGRGVYWGDVGGAGRPIGLSKEELAELSWTEIQENKKIPKSSGTIPFFGPSDRLTYAISQAGVRRSTEAVYLRDTHPDLLSFLHIRLETGDKNRRMPNLHHGVCLSNAFMNAVKNLEPWNLICPKTGKVTATIDAYDLWIELLTIRKTESGEPYIIFIDNVNDRTPIEYKKLGLYVYSSNICTEIVTHTAPDKTTICCLGSLNLEYWDEYKDNIEQVVADLTDYLHNILIRFLKETEGREGFEKARKAVLEEYNIGLGVMGWHSLLQKKLIPFESPMAIALNKQIFKAIRKASDDHQERICTENPELICPVSKKAGTKRRNIHTLAVAPTMSISMLCDLTSSGIEPWVTNAFVKKVPTGSFSIKNKYLDCVIRDHCYNVVFAGSQNLYGPEAWIEEQWDKIVASGGSVQGLDWMDEYTKDVFKTAFEINPLSMIKQMGDRADEVDQAVSNNIFLPAEVSYEELHTVHFKAWELGVKSLYYLRSEPETKAETGKKERKSIELKDDVCVACT